MTGSFESVRFRCGVCGEAHQGIPDVGFEAPYYYYTVPEDEREDRCALTADLCVIDGEDRFVRGVLEVPIVGREDGFGWGVWSSVSRANFERYRATFDADQGELDPFPGWLSSRLPGYPDTLGLVVRARPRDGGLRPVVELAPADHPLVADQRDGIALDRVRAILERVLHPDP